MRQVVRLAPLLCLGHQLLGRRGADQLHPSEFGLAEVADQILGTTFTAAQFVITDINHDGAQPCSKGHFSAIGRERRECFQERFLREVARNFLVGEKPLA